MAIAGVLGYYARSTPMAWADCQSIQLKQYRCRCWRSVVRIRYVRRRAARRGLLTGGSWGGGARACIWLTPRPRTLRDQFHRALSGSLGEPARIAVSERIAEKRLGCPGSPLEWESRPRTRHSLRTVWWAGEALIEANTRIQGGTHVEQGGSEEVSSACRRSADHGHMDEHAAHSVPTQRGTFAGWDA